MSNSKRINKKSSKLQSKCYVQIVKIDPVLFKIKGQIYNEYEAMVLIGKLK